ncbi:MAG: flagellar hook assembly protein FlgD [Gammaproteobacteria bacterium]|nr:flagellar hook assembly protein FlgD [Gammaproteobacteria bacterium]
MSTNIDTNALEKLGLMQKPSQAASKDRLGQDEFLKLMVAQLKNQDPMKPMQNGEFMAQMAQFSTVTGIQELQTSFSQFATAMQSNQALQASALVGRTVLAPGDVAVLAPGGGVSGAIDLPSTTSKLTVAVYSPSGQLVRRMDMGQQAGGLVDFKWDGKTDAGDMAPAGNYKLAAGAMISDKAVAVDTLVASTVESVTLGRGGQTPTVNVAGIGAVDMSNIRRIM